MSNLILELANRDHWAFAYTRFARAMPTTTNPGGYIPLPPWETDVVFDSPILAISASSTEVWRHWWLGCRVRQIFDFVFQTGFSGSTFRIPLNRGFAELVQFPTYAPQYQLQIEVPHWIPEMQVDIWQYNGPIGFTTDRIIQEQTDLIRVDLARIEHKIDSQ